MGDDTGLQSPRGAAFLRWPGAKKWLSTDLARWIGSVEGRYIEPFLGSGSVFFRLSPHVSILTDMNAHLINVYRQIKVAPDDVYAKVKEHSRLHSPEYYYSIRNRETGDIVQDAADFVYINRTCFNGIYRVNSKGKFNVPLGAKSNVLLSTDDFGSVSDCLKGATLSCCDFEDSICNASEGDVVFADPPYTVAHNNNGFIAYNESIFKWSDQERLACSLADAAKRGARIFVTNAAHASVRSLYEEKGFHITVLSRKSNISGSVSGRKAYDELLITSAPLPTL